MAADKAATQLINGGSPTVYVSDMDCAVKFYTEALGLKLAMRFGNEYAAVDAGKGFLVGLHPASPHSPKPGTSGSIQVGFGLGAPIEQVVRELTARGVSFRGPIIVDGPVKLAYFSDPDGNDLYLCQY